MLRRSGQKRIQFELKDELRRSFFENLGVLGILDFGVLGLPEFECVRKRDLETPSEVLLKRRLGLYKTHGKRSSETRDRSRGLSYDQRTQYRELIVQLRKENNITMASSYKEQAVWPETPAADSLKIQIANVFLDTLVMRRTLSAHRGL